MHRRREPHRITPHRTTPRSSSCSQLASCTHSNTRREGGRERQEKTERENEKGKTDSGTERERGSECLQLKGWMVTKACGFITVEMSSLDQTHTMTTNKKLLCTHTCTHTHTHTHRNQPNI